MNPFLLLKALRELLVPRLRELPLPVRGRDRTGAPLPDADEITVRGARVFLGSMPPTVNDGLSAAPFIVLQPMSGEDEEHLHNIRVAIRVCIVADDLEGAESDLFLLLSQVRLAILELPEGILGKGKFRLVPFAEGQSRCPWERPDEQVFPFLQAHIFTSWQTAGIAAKPNPALADYE